MTTDPRSQSRLDLAAFAGIALVVLASVWVRWPGFVQGGFASHDVAGMLYNAMVLDRGGLPYVDTIEIKAPGTFYLARVLAGPEGRDIARFQIWANLWAIGSLAAVAAIGWRTWGRTAAVLSAALYALHDANLDSMDANYVTWANLPQILAVGAALEAVRRPARAATVWWVVAGAAAGAAGLCKRPDGVVLVVVLAMALWPGAPGTGTDTAERRVRWRAGLAACAGVSLVHVPLAAHYLARGALGALVDGYVLNRWGLRYVAEKSEDPFVSEALLAFAFFVGLPLALAAFVVGRASAAHWRGPLCWLVAWAGVSLAAACVGARFYKGYFLASAAPLCLIAAAPWGLLGRERLSVRWLRPLALVLVAPLVLRAGLSLQHMREDRARPHDRGGRIIAAHLVENTSPEDRIWVWGWHLWDVYPLANRMAGSRIYKSLGLLTPPNDDSWRRPASPLRFVDGEYARLLLEDLERTRPRYIVLGSTVPHRDFEALHELLRRDYRRDHRVRVGKVQFWQRRDPPDHAGGGR